MKRERLVWFATGVAVSSIIAVCVAFATRNPPEDQGWFLRVAEQGQTTLDGRASAQWRGAEIARDCGARSFEMVPGVAADTVDATRIPLVRVNNPALGCVVERATEAGLWVGVGLEPLNAFK